MRILICNDDGIHATGIRKLAEHLAKQSENEVYVVAPDRERSATGHALTLHTPLRVNKVDLGENVKGAWETTGTPTDCVKLAVMGLLDKPPDVVVAGINHGANLGSDVFYSGTVSAAMEGAMNNIPSIAVSLVIRQDKHFETAADFIAQLLRTRPLLQIGANCLLNVNVPSLPASEIKGVTFTELGFRHYNDHFEKREDPRGKTYYWLAGHVVEESTEPFTDSGAVNTGCISITPVSFSNTNITDHASLSYLRERGPLEELSKPYCKGIKR